MIKDYLADTAEALMRVEVGEVVRAVEILLSVKDLGGTVWVVGNGGSAATAGHFANDLLKIGKVRAIAVHSLIPTVTAFGNDNGWEWMYADTIAHLKREGDALVAISCSGESPNVLRAAGLFPPDRLIVLTGNHFNSLLSQMGAEAKIFVKDPDIKVQEDVHLAVCHAIAGELRCA